MERGYSSSWGRVNYRVNASCAVCAVQFPRDHVVYSICDRSARCPCCGVRVRVGSFRGGVSVKSRRVYIIELDS